jgi:hypothetical protein
MFITQQERNKPQLNLTRVVSQIALSSIDVQQFLISLPEVKPIQI